MFFSFLQKMQKDIDDPAAVQQSRLSQVRQWMLNKQATSKKPDQSTPLKSSPGKTGKGTRSDSKKSMLASFQAENGSPAALKTKKRKLSMAN